MNKLVVIYLHGFLSSPKSEKAQLTQSFMAQHYPAVELVIPQISHYPDEAERQLNDLVSKYTGAEMRFIGSSMGGFFATYLIEKFGGKAVLINPAVTPHILLSNYLGKHINPNTHEAFELVPAHMPMLEKMQTKAVSHPENIWALVKTGDETLDYRQAVELYHDTKLTVVQGGDHSFADYEDYLPQIGQFLLGNRH